MKDGFVKVAAVSPAIRLADTEYNADKVIECMRAADDMGVKVLAFPELTLTGCSLYDLARHQVILDGAARALAKVTEASKGMDMLAFVGLPMACGSKVYSVAAAICDGDVLMLVPNMHPAADSRADSCSDVPDGIVLDSAQGVRAAGHVHFRHGALRALKAAVCFDGDDMTLCTAEGATLLVRMASFPATVTSTDDALLEARYVSKKLCCGYVLAAPGKGESTTDRVYSGLCLAAEDGTVLAQKEGTDSFAVTEIDFDYLVKRRRAVGGFATWGEESSEIKWGGELEETTLTRGYSRHPHLPARAEDVPAYCERMLDIQTSGLVRRMEYAKLDHCVVGISGGVDSTLAVMVSAMAVKRMGLPASNVVACTMPCFGTSSRTKSNAVIVAEQVGAEVRVIDIGKAVYQHFDDIGHAHDDYSIAFENAQARERTQVLMDVANKVNGLDVGTEDLSEFIDGWCTFNGDHISNYDVNLGLTKTQVRANVRHIAQTTDNKALAAALWDVLDCPVTPELLPIHDDQIEQKSEDSVGSYSLQDFFTHKIVICGFTPSKTFRLAKLAYGKDFTDEELIRWLKSYCRRYFSQQFKRSCLMDGPAVEAFTVSPRVGSLIPSDAENALFLADVERLEKEVLG